MINLDSILKSRDITLPTKVCLVKAMVFPVVLYGCESWTIRKGECQWIDAFELWCWRRFLRVPWIARRSNQSILKEISPEYSLEGLMLKLKLQHFARWEELTHLKRPWCCEWLKVGEGHNRRPDGWMPSPTPRVYSNSCPLSWWWIGRPGVLHSMESQRVIHDWVTELRLIIAFLPRSKYLLISWLQFTICRDFGAQEKKSNVTISIVSSSICHEVACHGCHGILIFWMLSFKPVFSLSSFTFIKRLFSSSSPSSIRVVPSTYLWLLIFLLAILIPAYASSNLTSQVIYSAYKLNKQSDTVQPWCTLFPIWNLSVVPCPVLTIYS